MRPGQDGDPFCDLSAGGGLYEGFDVEKPSIDWCRRAITSRFPLIRFKHVSLSNEMYNPDGTTKSTNFIFPYRDRSFDLVFLGSVFTHLFDEEVGHYLKEIGRVLKPGGRCISTYYLMNEDKRVGILAGTSAFTFSIPHRGAFIEHPSPPEGAVAHEEARILEHHARALLMPVGAPRYGDWAVMRRQSQDFIVSERS